MYQFAGVDTSKVEWGAWFGSFKTRAAARRYLTIEFTGPGASDRDSWVDSDVQQGVDGSWQVRLAQHPVKEA